MGTLTPFGTSPFDILFRNFFDNEGEFAPFNQIRVNHPVDIYEDDNGLCIDIACVGLTKKDIDLTIEGDILRVEYKKVTTKDSVVNYIQKNIAKRAFNFGWRISRRFDLTKLDAKLQNGLLHLHAPYADDSKPKAVTIK
jgi:HSP20 family molecular chaperone IbpA